MRGAGWAGESSCTGNGQGKTEATASYDRRAACHPSDGKVDGCPGVAAFGRQRRKRDGVSTESEDVIGADHTLVAKAEVVARSKRGGRERKSGCASRVGTAKR